jgi:hypothetical protein
VSCTYDGVIKNNHFNYDIRKKEKKVVVVAVKELPYHVVTAAAILVAYTPPL